MKEVFLINPSPNTGPQQMLRPRIFSHYRMLHQLPFARRESEERRTFRVVVCPSSGVFKCYFGEPPRLFCQVPIPDGSTEFIFGVAISEGSHMTNSHVTTGYANV